MLKITMHTDGHSTTFELEGRLAGPWVEELKGCWERAAGSQGRVLVDLTEVTFIDSDGKALLTRMHREGAELKAAGCLTRCIVEAITRGSYDEPEQACADADQRGN
jgi:anti-anti-sigma regulatory factor